MTKLKNLYYNEGITDAREFLLNEAVQASKWNDVKRELHLRKVAKDLLKLIKSETG